MRAHGADPASDFRELYKRVIFTILVSNKDDHLKNHGFLDDGRGQWRLSPIFDVEDEAKFIVRDMALRISSEWRVALQRAGVVGYLARLRGCVRSRRNGTCLGAMTLGRLDRPGVPLSGAIVRRDTAAAP